MHYVCREGGGIYTVGRRVASSATIGQHMSSLTPPPPNTMALALPNLTHHTMLPDKSSLDKFSSYVMEHQIKPNQRLGEDTTKIRERKKNRTWGALSAY
jgi:hypothetical protein